jgi:transposase
MSQRTRTKASRGSWLCPSWHDLRHHCADNALTFIRLRYLQPANSATNTAIDFLAFVIDGHLSAGDVLICDNASIHFAADIQAPRQLLLTAIGIRLLFMPTYSPESNPYACELVFAQIKNHLRHHLSLHVLAHHDLVVDVDVDVVVGCASFYLNQTLGLTSLPPARLL